MQTVNENNLHTVRFNFTYEGAPVSPSTVDWKMTDVASKRVQVEWTSATVQTETDGDGAVISYYVTVTVPASANVMVGTGKRELKEVMVSAEKDTDGEYNQTYQYYVLNTSRN